MKPGSRSVDCLNVGGSRVDRVKSGISRVDRVKARISRVDDLVNASSGEESKGSSYAESLPAHY